MLEVILWLLVLELLGLMAFPLLYVLLPWLPDRGYAFARPVGLVLAFYPFWLLASTPLVPNSAGVLVGILMALALLTGWLVWRRRQELSSFLKAEWPLLLLVEVVFLGVFVFWATVISYGSAISHTEQPMDFAFLNATVASRHFPPNDPWLSGAQVSYYYFGYLIFGGLARLVGISTAAGYNLALASIAGLAAMAAFGLVYNLVRLVGGKAAGAALAGLLAVLLLLFTSNLEGGLEMMRAGGKESPEFWQWVDVKGLDGPKPSDHWYPTEEGWWWWRASRVIDTVEGGQSRDYTITEFPFFSLLLGDLHPHLMSLPFLLAFLGLALGYLVSPGQGLRWIIDHGALVLLLTLLLGALGFINLWDLPVFGGLLVAIGVVKGHSVVRKNWREGLTPLLAAIGVVGLAVVMYLPFFFSFQSQADGVLPVERYVSRPLHLFLVWGLFVMVVVMFLLWELASALRSRVRRWKALAVALLAALSPWTLWALAEGVRLWDVGDALKAAWQRLVQVGPLVALMAAAGYLALRLAREVRQPLDEGAEGDAVQGDAVQEEAVQGDAKELAVVNIGVESGGDELSRAEGDPSEVTGATVSNPTEDAAAPGAEKGSLGLARAYPFVLLGMAALLVMGPELFRVADLFGNRMNTMFKLSYQAWALLALASSYALYSLVARLAKAGALGRLLLFTWLGVVTAGMVTSLYYPAAAAYTKAAPSPQVTLDGLAYVARSAPGEYQAIQWLRQSYRDGEVMVEAVGDDYSDYGRVSSSTGVPTVLGWTFHEEQWRGSRRPFEGRQEAVRRLYQTGDVGEARAILKGYGVTYIYVGSRERSKYGTDGLTKFTQLGTVAFQEGDVVVYRVRE